MELHDANTISEIRGQNESVLILPVIIRSSGSCDKCVLRT
jgi:hypothetical protein